MYFALLFIGELISLFFLSQFLTRSISGILLRLTRNETLTIYLLSFLFLPGVIVHELAHLLTAALLLVPVGHIEFFPKVTEHGVKLGSVAIGKTDVIRRAIIGFAPVLFGIAIILGLLYYLTIPGTFSPHKEWVTFVIAFYVLFEVGNTMFSSSKDVEGTLELLGVIGIISVALLFIGIRPPEVAVDFFNSNVFLEVYKRASLFLLAPLLVDVVLSIFTWGLLRKRY